MEFFKSLCLVGINKFNYHFNRESKKLKPERIYEEDDYIKKLNSYLFSEPDHIIDNIYLGNGNNAANINTINKYDIKFIINVTQELDNYFEPDIKYFKCELLDEKENNISNFFPKIIEIFNKNKENNILIHCFMGSSRSAVMVLLYLIKFKNMTLEDSLKFLKKKRDIININKEFINQLKLYLK